MKFGRKFVKFLAKVQNFDKGTTGVGNSHSQAHSPWRSFFSDVRTLHRRRRKTVERKKAILFQYFNLIEIRPKIAKNY